MLSKYIHYCKIYFSCYGLFFVIISVYFAANRNILSKFELQNFNSKNFTEFSI